jgi:hypothetical protein
MLESLTIFSKGGLVLYQYLADPTLLDKEKAGGAASPGFTTAAINQTLIRKFLLDPAKNDKNFHISEGTSFVWAEDSEKCAIALYPDILFEGPRQYLKEWATSLVGQAIKEYDLFQRNAVDKDSFRPDPAPFDKTFRVILDQSKNKKYDTPASTGPTTTTPDTTADQQKQVSTTDKKKTKKGKEKRTWGEAKVTDKAMAALDMSKKEDTSADAVAESESRALEEARAAYLPTKEDLQETESETKTPKEPSWSSTAVGWFQQIAGNKVLDANDLEKPLKEMESFLTSKNVANEIAAELCAGVKTKLVGKKLNSLYRVQTAVQQALEATTTKLLQHDIDLLRNVLSKRGDSIFSMSKKAPYVICVVGINGVGKSTSVSLLRLCCNSQYSGMSNTKLYSLRLHSSPKWRTI